MSPPLITLLTKGILSRVIDTENFRSKTNAATGIGGLLGTAALILKDIPEPNAQIASAVLGLASFICVMYKEAPRDK